MTEPFSDADQGWLAAALRRRSPHHDARPPGTSVDLLVIHGVSLPSGQFGGPWIDALFMGCLDRPAQPALRPVAGLRVSAHLLIRRNGALIQYVDLDARAWHAGESSFDGRRACNDFSVGVELEGTDEQRYTREQYRTLVAASRAILRRFPAITGERIVGHCDIAPGRKTDPGAAFDWAAYRRAISCRDGTV